MRQDTKAYDVLVRLLSRRDHFEAEARAKLRQRGFEAEAIEDAVSRAREMGYLDERRAVDGWIRMHLRKGGHGRAWLVAGLEARGVGRDHGRTRVDDLFPREDEVRAAADVVARQRLDRRERIASRLRSRGFDSSVISEVLRRVAHDEERE